MISRKLISFEELNKSIGFWDTVCGLVHDECRLIDVLAGLREAELHQIYWKDEPIGFFTVEPHSTDAVEIHAFIEPAFRRYSLRALKEMEEATPKSIATSVWGTHPHVLPALKRLGFTLTHTDKDELIKGGVVYDIHHLYKEKDNGK